MNIYSDKTESRSQIATEAAVSQIGRIFIDICRGFGMRAIAYDAFPAKDSGIEYASRDELFEKRDITKLILSK